MNSLPDRVPLKPLAKAGVVAAGYFAACVLATAVVAIHVAATNGPDRQGASGMYAFGDSLFFLAAFGVASIPATGTALYFLRPCRSFWRVHSVVALAIATSGLAAIIAYASARSIGPGSIGPGSIGPASIFSTLSSMSVLRILIAPLFAVGFFLSGLFAPNRPSRSALLIAAAADVVVFSCFMFILARPLWSR